MNSMSNVRQAQGLYQELRKNSYDIIFFQWLQSTFMSAVFLFSRNSYKTKRVESKKTFKQKLFNYDIRKRYISVKNACVV